MIDTINKAPEFISEQIDYRPSIAIILGTGLGALVDNIKDPLTIPYADIPGFSVSSAPSHKGQLLLGELMGKKVMVMQGRLHYYEGLSMSDITFPIRVMKELGVRKIIITNASGSLREHLQPGSIVLIKDHINFMGTNPLIGANDPHYGDRFPSMNDCYAAELRTLASKIAEEENIKLEQGVYIAVSGPSLETVSECRALANWGADIVGMSTVPEVIVAVQCGIPVLGLSIVTNMSNLFHQQSHLQADIEATAAGSYPQTRILIQKIVERITE